MSVTHRVQVGINSDDLPQGLTTLASQSAPFGCWLLGADGDVVAGTPGVGVGRVSRWNIPVGVKKSINPILLFVLSSIMPPKIRLGFTHKKGRASRPCLPITFTTHQTRISPNILTWSKVQSFEFISFTKLSSVSGSYSISTSFSANSFTASDTSLL